jgi:hypothetical protein
MSTTSSDEKAVVQNKKVVLRRYVTGRFPTENDMEIIVDTISLRVPSGLRPLDAWPHEQARRRPHRAAPRRGKHVYAAC